jgi:hypothetical protein
MARHRPKPHCIVCGRVVAWGRVLCRQCRLIDHRLPPLDGPPSQPRPMVQRVKRGDGS